MSRKTTEITRSEPANLNPNPQQVEALAYQLWVQRGRPNGSDQFDWFRAEEELRKAGTQHQRVA